MLCRRIKVNKRGALSSDMPRNGSADSLYVLTLKDVSFSSLCVLFTSISCAPFFIADRTVAGCCCFSLNACRQEITVYIDSVAIMALTHV